MGPDDIDQEQIDAGVEEIAGSLGLGQSEDEHVEVVTDPETPITPATQVATVRNPPKSWAKEYHEPGEDRSQGAGVRRASREADVGRDRAVQGPLRVRQDDADVITPYKALIASQGIDEAKAVGVLMNAHYKMSSLPPPNARPTSRCSPRTTAWISGTSSSSNRRTTRRPAGPSREIRAPGASRTLRVIASRSSASGKPPRPTLPPSPMRRTRRENPFTPISMRWPTTSSPSSMQDCL
jgi:hypothetical protein